MQKIRIDFDNPGLPQHISAVENDSQSRFFQATLYENGKAYTAPAGASYSIMYRGFGPQNQGWYDTINDGAGKRAACTASGNVVTCEIARQALQVPGHVSVVLCVTTGKGYMLKSWPIECDCKNDRYDSTAEIQSFFYVTQVSNADWNRAIQAVEEFKNMIDPTLSLSGKAADAKGTGDAVSRLKEDVDNVKAELPNVGKVKSVNGKQGDVIITSEDIGYSAPEETINNTVKKWLNDHPEATTTVQDGAITLNKLSKDAVKDTIDMSYGQIGTPMVSFVTDDGQLTDYTIFYKKIFKPLGVPASTAVIGKAVDINPNWLTTEQCKEMKSDGWTVASHTYNDLVTNESGVTKGDIETDFKLSSKWLFDRGLDYDIYVAPHGSWTPDTDECARKIFRCCILTGHMFNDGAYDITGIGRTGIFDNYSILRRSGIGDLDNEGNAITKEGMIADIQYAVKNNLWLVFVMHSWKAVFSEGQTGVDDLIEVVTYCKTNNIPIVNLKDGLRLKGNTIDVGERINGKKWCRVGANGSFYYQESMRSAITNSENKNYYVKVAELYADAGGIDFGVVFDFYVTNFTDGYILPHGKVTAIFKSGYSQGELCSARMFYVIHDAIPNSGESIKFIAVDNNVRYGNKIDIYCKFSRINSNVIITNIHEILKNSKRSYVNVEVSRDYISDVTPTYTAVFKNDVRVLSNEKPSQSLSIGEIAVDDVLKKAYISYSSGYNKWIELMQKKDLQSNVNDTISMEFDDSGTDGITFRMNDCRYFKIGQLVILSCQIIGTLNRSVVKGNMKITGVPFKPMMNTPVLCGGWSFPSTQPKSMYVGTDGIIVTNASPDATLAQTSFNIIFETCYFTKS